MLEISCPVREKYMVYNIVLYPVQSTELPHTEIKKYSKLKSQTRENHIFFGELEKPSTLKILSKERNTLNKGIIRMGYDI